MAVFVLLFAHHVQAQSLRIVAHDSDQFVRIAFDWPEITAYTIKPNSDDNNIVITFAENTSLTIPTITDAMNIYVDNISRLSDNQISIQLQNGMTFRPFRFNNSIVFDIMQGDFAEAVENYQYLQEANPPVSTDSSLEILETKLNPPHATANYRARK